MNAFSDGELERLWVLKRDATVLFSISACCLALAFGLWLEPDPGMDSEVSSEIRSFLVEVGVPLFALVAALFTAMGWFALKRLRLAAAVIAKQKCAGQEELVGSRDSREPGIVASAREPSRSLLRW